MTQFEQIEQKSQKNSQSFPFSVLIIFLLIIAIITTLVILFFQGKITPHSTFYPENNKTSEQLNLDFPDNPDHQDQNFIDPSTDNQSSPLPAPLLPSPQPTTSDQSTPDTNSDSVSGQSENSTPQAINSDSSNSIISQSRLDGILHLQGEIPAESEILLLVRAKGETDYQTLGHYRAERQINWSWSGAKTNQIYEITFALQINQNNVHTSPIATAKAPATIEIWMNTKN